MPTTSSASADLERILREEIAEWPGEATASVVTGEGVLARAGPDRPYAWASVTKLLSALTILDTVKDGIVHLEEPAGPPGSTLKHLLAHASGLALEGDRVLAAPGQRRIYSNSGIEKAAQLLERRSGQAFSTLVTQRVLDRLGMLGTVIDGSPAHGAVGPVSDLDRLAWELLMPRELDPGLVAQATTTAFPGLSGVLPGFGRQEPNDWGLGFELRGTKVPHWTAGDASPRTFGHFGQSGAFLWVDPHQGVACVAAGRADFGPWASEAWPRLSARVLAAVASREIS